MVIAHGLPFWNGYKSSPTLPNSSYLPFSPRRLHVLLPVGYIGHRIARRHKSLTRGLYTRMRFTVYARKQYLPSGSSLLRWIRIPYDNVGLG